MPEARLSADYVGYRDAAAAILTRQGDESAVAAFGLADVFAGGSDHAPAYAFLEAQGHTGASTSALSRLALTGVPVDDGSLLALPFGRRGLLGVAGLTPGTGVVADAAGRGLVRLDDPRVVRHGGEPADDHVTVLTADLGACPVLLTDIDGEALLARARLGLSAELLGIATRLFDDALAYARTRRQFGQAIGDFQAVQHLLAWSATELHSLRSLYDVAVQRQAAHGLDLVLATSVKALAGRVLLSVAQTAIQVTGAISFTWEYGLNRLHHRGLALDQLAGPSADLVAEIGRGVRTSGAVPVLFELSDITS